MGSSRTSHFPSRGRLKYVNVAPNKITPVKMERDRRRRETKFFCCKGPVEFISSNLSSTRSPRINWTSKKCAFQQPKPQFHQFSIHRIGLAKLHIGKGLQVEEECKGNPVRRTASETSSSPSNNATVNAKVTRCSFPSPNIHISIAVQKLFLPMKIIAYGKSREPSTPLPVNDFIANLIGHCVVSRQLLYVLHQRIHRHLVIPVRIRFQ